ncbi:MAG: helix-turn-helix transcriptional regulator [Ruminococcaceae bacterium]|nr:helix-turn-helix transcriptional regulator [Oscillospiraceae bacterium]
MLENLRKLRDEAGVTQKRLADAIGVSQQSINKYENHNVEPDISTLIRIAGYFDVSVDYLVGHPITSDSVDDRNLSPEEICFIQKLRRLSPKQVQCVKMIMDSYEAQ